MSKKILVIEDDKLLSDLLGKKLKDIGFEVAFAFTGAEGLASLRANKPDLILLDIVMPEKNGVEVMEEMNKNPETDLTKIPVIIISNSGQPVEIKRVLELGAKDYLIKANFNPQEVVEKVIKQIGD
ncbi:response regulator [Patescibacteria group bacterium]|nr:response regulator [Patescibacteria group bacterium]